MLLSVITINLNNKNGLKQTIDSVVGQEFNDYEYIVIDGASTDGSRELIEEYKHKITYAISEKDSGIYNAMNKGIKLASGKYLLFLNSGDVLVNNKITGTVFNKNTSCDILYGNMLITEDEHRRLGKMPDHLTVKHMIRDTLWHPVSFIKKALFLEYGYYDESLRITSDYDFFLKVFNAGVSMCHTQETIAVFRTDGLSSLPENRQSLLEERKKVQLRYFTEKEIERNLHISIFERIKNKITGILKR